MDFSIFAILTQDGITNGAIYALVALALVLVFVGGKMLLAYWFHIPVLASLLVVGGILLISVILSLVLTRNKAAS